MIPTKATMISPMKNAARVRNMVRFTASREAAHSGHNEKNENLCFVSITSRLSRRASCGEISLPPLLHPIMDIRPIPGRPTYTQFDPEHPATQPMTNHNTPDTRTALFRASTEPTGHDPGEPMGPPKPKRRSGRYVNA